MGETCVGCGFEWDAVTAEGVPDRLAAIAAGFAEVLRSGDPALGERPDAETWSVVEYSAHVRDVMFNLRDRIVVGLVEDDPTPKPTYTIERIAAGLYADEVPDRLALEIDVGTALLGRTIAALDDDKLARPIFYGWPRPATRDLLWVAAQAVHEGEHHLADVQAQAASPS
jgi:hypothetical protein